MNLNNPYSCKFVSLPTLMLIIAWVVLGCSGSNDTVLHDEQPSNNSTASETNNSDANANANSGQNTDAIEADTDTESNNIAADDPLIRSKIPHTFEINVPFYLSDQLRVELVWGEIKLTAMWLCGYVAAWSELVG